LRPITDLMDRSHGLPDIGRLTTMQSALGCRDTAKAHMSGLSQILEMRDDEMITDGNIFQSLVIL
jgi:hypothetical protein